MRKRQKIGWGSTAAIVVANMVGTGVFTSLGLQLEVLRSPWSIVCLWLLGGGISLLGAFSYAELGTKLPRSGGEYHFLSVIYHPFLGYLSGWVSLTVGFAAAVALSAMAMGAYLSYHLAVPSQVLATVAILAISLAHSMSLRTSSRFQNLFTLLKILLLLFLVSACFWVPAGASAATSSTSASLFSELSQPAFAIALVYVVYAFSGWNAAAYIVEEIDDPKRNLPRALIGGTLVVSLLYVLLQWGFMRQASIEQLQGKVEVGQVVAALMFGEQGGLVISFFIALFLVSSISAMVWVGPRVVRAMANDYQVWGFLARDNARGIPVRAVWLQAVISIFMIATSSFEQVLLYSGFVLQLFTTAAVGGVIVLRLRGGKTGYQSPFFPWGQLIYLAVSGWMLAYLLYDRPLESLLGFANLAIGSVSYWWSRRQSTTKTPSAYVE